MALDADPEAGPDRSVGQTKIHPQFSQATNGLNHARNTRTRGCLQTTFAMTDEAKKCLARPDPELFICGACHVFASRLSSLLAPGSYELVGVHVKYPGIREPFSKVVHIVCKSGSEIIHAPGIEQWTTYVTRTRDEILRKNPDIKGDVNLTQVPVQRDQLLKWTKSTEARGALNCWDFLVDSDFVEEAGRRATELIGRNPSKYGASP